ncbi:MAG: hypothetical protein CMJ68_19390, partial [Planctomycetaceae bacterium]|nr:hypothetical protein [Planctomycetaceae bacterium]
MGDSAAKVKKVVSDDEATVSALKDLGAVFKRGGDGRITEVSLRGATLKDADLAALESLSNLQSVLLNDTGVTDKGLETLVKI